jgi:hypothetical protein
MNKQFCENVRVKLHSLLVYNEIDDSHFAAGRADFFQQCKKYVQELILDFKDQKKIHDSTP